MSDGQTGDSPLMAPDRCRHRRDGRCMDKVDVHAVKKWLAALLGSLPGVLIVVLSSHGFSTVRILLNNSTPMMLSVYVIVFLAWILTIWISTEIDQPNVMGYTSFSAALLSSIFGFGATVSQFLIPTSP